VTENVGAKNARLEISARSSRKRQMVENAGVEKIGTVSRGGKCRSGSNGTVMQCVENVWKAYGNFKIKYLD